jgi:hypothetical protein
MVDEICSKSFDQWKQDKFQWLEDPSEINKYKKNDIKCEVSNDFMGKRRNILKTILITSQRKVGTKTLGILQRTK